MHCSDVSHSFRAVPHRAGTTVDHKAGTTAQRIRIGLTGLAFAFLFVLLFSVITRSSADKGPVAAEQNATLNEPSEPLAELGVAPGSKASDDSANNLANQ